ncbi:MAG: stage IV sporulation protein A [Oscillospiraceae bacterium]|jgi:stage IV sporulation protein A|nr:stage IV sporulation protein A [Oscillospiraceae bacterium]
MEERSIYADIANRTQGDIYIGVVGPVRTGKSTFVKAFMDTLVIPNIPVEAKRERALDELPQSASGRTIMTTEPKFIPEEAVEIALPGNAKLRVRLIDCVGYIVPSSLGYIEDDQPRMVLTPWFEEEVPFNMAAETGTRKVITEHSTIGLVITTDGSFSEIPREEYAESEERVITELQALNKPFVVLLNSAAPESPETTALAQQLSAKHNVPVMPVNCLSLNEWQIKQIISQILFEFPIREISVNLPGWVVSLESDHWLRKSIYHHVRTAAQGLRHVRDSQTFASALHGCEHVRQASLGTVNLADGATVVDVTVHPELFYKVLAESTGLEINDENDLLRWLSELSKTKSAYERIKNALGEVEATGYGIVMPSLEELTLEEPELMRQGGRYGVRLRASAPSLHIMKANISTEVAPIVGSESQSEELVMYLLNEFEENPQAIWQSNIFGKSLHELVNEGLHNKLYQMPLDARSKFQETIEKIINEGCSGLICIIL